MRSFDFDESVRDASAFISNKVKGGARMISNMKALTSSLKITFSFLSETSLLKREEISIYDVLTEF